MYHRTPITGRKGFTLIELLVVIAIIAILAAILFPVFARAKAKARQATCLSNVKQLGLAVLMYMSDYHDMYPLFETTQYDEVHGPEPDGTTYPELYHPITGERCNMSQTRWFTKFWRTADPLEWNCDLTTPGGFTIPYNKNLSILECLDWELDPPRGTTTCGPQPFESYAANGALGYSVQNPEGCVNAWAWANEGVRSSRVVDPADTVMIGDSAANIGYGLIMPPCWGSAGAEGRPAWGRHAPRFDSLGDLVGGIINFCWCDGHAAAIDSRIVYPPGDCTYFDYQTPPWDDPYPWAHSGGSW